MAGASPGPIWPLCEGSMSLPGGNQVDGLPPVPSCPDQPGAYSFSAHTARRRPTDILFPTRWGVARGGIENIPLQCLGPLL